MTDEQPRLIPIGIANTPFETPDEAPNQGFMNDVEATIEVFPSACSRLTTSSNSSTGQ